jgi:hypothetical protein
MAGTASVRRRTSTGDRPSSLVGETKLTARLAVKQLNDEVQLAVGQMKAKGIRVGIAAGLAAGALVFLALMVVALLVSAIMGLGLVVEPWLAALIVAAFFLVVGGILALIGVSRIKKAMPLVPEDAIRGIRHDIGVLKEGTAFDPSTLDEKKAKPEDQDVERKKEKPEPVPYDELLRRSRERREHLARLRDDLGPRLNVKKQAGDRAHRFSAAADERAHRFSETARPAGDNAARLLRERWQPLAVMAASLVALATFLRKLFRG